MEQQKQKNIAEKPATEVSQQRRKGFDQDTDQEDLIIPRVKLIQKTSEEVDDESLDVKPGDLINSLTKDKFNKPLLFVPICRKTFYRKYNPMSPDAFGFDPNYEPGALIYTVDSRQECPDKDAEWVEGRPPLAKKYINYLSFLPDYPAFPVVIGFHKTSLKAGQRIYSILKVSGCHMFERQFVLNTELRESNGNKFYVLKETQKGKPTEEVIAKCDKLYDDLAPKATEHLNKDDEEVAPWE